MSPITIDKEFLIHKYSKCNTCVFFVTTSERSCMAFDDIPLPIWNGEIEHDILYPGDNEFVYEQIPGTRLV